MSHSAFCGLSRGHLGELVTELAPRWEARCESGRRQRRRGDRRRQAGAGPKYELMFTDRLLVTLVHLRTGLTHEALGVIYQVGSSTIGRAIGEIRPLLAERGFAVPQRPGLRRRTLADVFAYAEAENVTLRIDGTETQVRRPKAGRPGRAAFVSGKRKQNTIKSTPSATARDAPSGAGRCGRAGCTTRPRCAPRGSLNSYHDIATGVLASSVARRAPGYTSLGFPDPRHLIRARPASATDVAEVLN
jgi:hypothetical protein